MEVGSPLFTKILQCVPIPILPYIGGFFDGTTTQRRPYNNSACARFSQRRLSVCRDFTCECSLRLPDENGPQRRSFMFAGRRQSAGKDHARSRRQVLRASTGKISQTSTSPLQQERLGRFTNAS